MQSGKQIGDMILFPLQLMQERDVAACTSAKSCGYVSVYSINVEDIYCPGQVAKIAMPRFIMHGTGLPEALSILNDRQVTSTSGICGAGDYGWHDHDDDGSVCVGWAMK